MKLKVSFVKLAALGVPAAAVLAAVLTMPHTAVATPALNFNSQILARSLFEAIHIKTYGDDNPQDVDAFRVEIDARDPTDVYVVDNKVPPGGNSGWHTHPGPSVVLVKTGTATVYDGDDPSCTPKTYPAGSGFVDAGGGHVHLVRNAGQVNLELLAFQMVPTGASRRIDAPDPGFCPSL
jgi:quercetin dioxygenase-like cupin family protein